MSDNPNQQIGGAGVFTPPAGMTIEEAERLAREADERRKQES